MRQALANVAVGLNLDRAANSVMERLYARSGTKGGNLPRRFQILTYHKVSLDPHPYFPPTPPRLFEQQMRFLKKCYRVMPLSEVVERDQEGTLPDRAVAVTLDDGYRDNYEFAFPILRQYQLPATIFVASGAIETGEILWHDRIFDAFRFAMASRARLHHPELGDLPLESTDARRTSLERVLDRARCLYGNAQMRLVEDIEKALAPAFPADHHQPRMLTWDQIREMRKGGIEFGSHTVTHPVLSQVPPELARTEILDSTRHLSQQLGEPIALFAYPNGRKTDYNEDVKTLLRESGYASAVTTERGYNPMRCDPFELKRSSPWPDRLGEFRINFCLERHGWAT